MVQRGGGAEFSIGYEIIELVEPELALRAKRLGLRALASSMYLVEQGEPPQGKHSRLPSIPVTC